MSGFQINSTLQLTTEQGFPAELLLDRHREKQFSAADFEGRTFTFQDKPGARIYLGPPMPVLLVHNINGKWLYWGKAVIVEQTIHSSADGTTQSTSGHYQITMIFDPAYQEQITRNGTNPGESYF